MAIKGSRTFGIALAEILPAMLFTGIAIRTIIQTDNVAALDFALKGVFFGLCIVILFIKKTRQIGKGALTIATMIVLYSVLPAFHHLTNANINDYGYAVEERDLLRLAVSCCFVFFAGLLASDNIQVRKVALWLVILGAITSIFAARHALTGVAENSGRYLAGGIIRAGSETSDSNVLAAYLNLSGLMCIYLIVAEKSIPIKLVLIATFILVQAARVLTFSTGGHIGFLFGVVVLFGAYILTRRPSGEKFKIIALLAVTAGLAWVYMSRSPERLEMIFSRFDYGNQYIYESSIGSRLEQYEDFIDLLVSDMAWLWFGIGYAETVDKLKLGFEIHNIFLRAISGGGLVGLLIYLGFMVSVERLLRDLYKSARGMAQGRDWLFYFIIYAAFWGWMLQAMTLPADVSVLTFFFAVISALLSRSRGKGSAGDEVRK